MASVSSEAAAPSHGGSGPSFEYLHAIEPTTTTRPEMLSDGVFAVAMTILVLDLKLPPLSPGISASEYFDAVFALWPKFIVFVCSFITLGRLWEIHRYVFHFLKSCDQTLLFWNTLILIFVCCVPFSTSIAGEHPYFSLSAAIYAGNCLALNLVYRGLWHHALHGDHLVKGGLKPGIRKAVTRRFNVFFVLMMLALVLSYFNSLVSIGLIVVHQLVMFFMQPIFKGQRT